MTRWFATGTICVCLFAVVLAFAGDGDDAATQPAATQPAATQPAADKELFEYAGQVLDPDGKPVEGATAVVYDRSWFDYWTVLQIGKAKTDVDGRFSISARPIRAYNDIFLVIYKDGFAIAIQELNPWQGAYCVLHLSGPVALAGTIVDDVGNPVAGARICPGIPQRWDLFYACMKGLAAPLVAVTDENGRFRLNCLPAGTVVKKFYVAANGMASAIITENHPDACLSKFELGSENITLRMHKEAVISLTHPQF